MKQPKWIQMAQTRTALFLWLHCEEAFTSITGEAALRLSILVVFQVGGFAKNKDSASDEGQLLGQDLRA